MKSENSPQNQIHLLCSLHSPTYSGNSGRIPVGIPDSGWIPVGFRLGFRIPGGFRVDSGGIPVLELYLTVIMFLYLLLLDNSRNTYSRHLKFVMVIVIHVIYKSK